MSELKDLAVKVEEPKPAQGETEEREVYPSLRFNGEEAAKIGLSKCRYGEEYEMTIHVRVTSIGGGMYPGSGNTADKPPVEFDVIAGTEPEELDGSQEYEDDEPKDEKPAKKAKQRVVSPSEMGLDDES